MRIFRLLSVFLVAALFAVLQNGAHSQLRAVEEPLPVQDLPAAATQAEAASAVEAGANTDRFYDAANPERQVLQKAEEVRRTLPLDKRGAIDWMTALRNGAIAPRADLEGNARPEVLNLDVILKNTKEMPFVRFPHNSHTEWLACSNCHDSLFVPKAGANQITMEKIFRGQFCGTCHDRVAFVTHTSCERCHSVPHANSTQWW